MIEPETYVAVLREELAHVYAENLSLKAAMLQPTSDRSQLLDLLARIDPDQLEDRVLNMGWEMRTGVAFIEAIREVIRAELGECETEGRVSDDR